MRGGSRSAVKRGVEVKEESREKKSEKKLRRTEMSENVKSGEMRKGVKAKEKQGKKE